ncbi:hypothetical protein DVW12_17310 [Clostridium botulinum]|nr:hypothetical protein [Clostridium botulinum]
MNKLPLNIPVKTIYKYTYVIEKNYDILIKEICNVSYFSTFKQFYALYHKLYPSLSKNYVIKKSNKIIHELSELGFIKIDNINRNKYFYFKKPALALFSGDYNKVPHFVYSQYIKNDKFVISLMKLEYYIKNNSIINNSNIRYHLLILTKKIYLATLKNNLDYNIKDLEFIINELNYENIKRRVITYPSDNLIKIIWIDLYNIYKKLSMQNQTISIHPIHCKLYIIKKTLRLHYAPNILIFDVHDIKYYEKKLNNLFHEFFNINTNVTKDLQSNYKKNSELGLKQNNHIGYSLSLIGYDLEALEKKIFYINRSIYKNPHTPLIKDVDYIYIDIAKYLSHSSQYNSSLANADKYVNRHITELLNSLN